MPADRPIMMFETAEDLEGWLAEHHVSSDGIWLKLAKKGTGVATASYEEAVLIGLCFGWIDSQAKRLDETYYLQAFTPRRSRSPWSALNVQRVADLVAAGRMTPAGLAEVERAKADGRWAAAYEGPAKAQAPADFLEALERNPPAKAFYETLDSQNRYAVYFRLQGVMRPETRERRIAAFVEQLARGERFH